MARARSPIILMQTQPIGGGCCRVRRRLLGGRNYLNGDRMTASDIRFATAAAPAIREFGAHKAGAFVVRIYNERSIAHG